MGVTEILQILVPAARGPVSVYVVADPHVTVVDGALLIMIESEVVVAWAGTAAKARNATLARNFFMCECLKD